MLDIVGTCYHTIRETPHGMDDIRQSSAQTLPPGHRGRFSLWYFSAPQGCQIRALDIVLPTTRTAARHAAAAFNSTSRLGGGNRILVRTLSPNITSPTRWRQLWISPTVPLRARRGFAIGLNVDTSQRRLLGRAECTLVLALDWCQFKTTPRLEEDLSIHATTHTSPALAHNPATG